MSETSAEGVSSGHEIAHRRDDPGTAGLRVGRRPAAATTMLFSSTHGDDGPQGSSGLRRLTITPGHYNAQLSAHALGVRVVSDAASTVGLCRGDVIVAINSVRVHLPAEVRARIDSTEPSATGVRSVEVEYYSAADVEHQVAVSQLADPSGKITVQRALLRGLGFAHDAVTAVASACDIVFDLLMLREYYAEGRHGFFAASLGFMILAQMTYAFAFATNESFKMRNDTFRSRVLKFFAVLPVAQLVPIFWYVESLHIPRVERLLERCGFAEQSRRRSIEEDARLDREVIDAIGSESSLSVPMALLAKARAHGGFVMEAVVEAIPQAALQTVAALTASSVTLTASTSILLSLIVIASKSWTVALSRHLPTMAFKAACVVADVTSAFAAIFWVFSFEFAPLSSTLRGWYVMLTLAGVGSTLAFACVFLGAIITDNLATNRAWAQQEAAGLLADPVTGVVLQRAEFVAVGHVLIVSLVSALPLVVALFSIRLTLLLLELGVREGNEFGPEPFYTAMQRYVAGHWKALADAEVTDDDGRRRKLTVDEKTTLRTHAACRYLRHLREGLAWFAECRRRDQLERLGMTDRANYLAFACKVGHGPGKCASEYRADLSRGRAPAQAALARGHNNAALEAAAALRGVRPRPELAIPEPESGGILTTSSINTQLYAAGIILELPDANAPTGRASSDGFLVASFQRQSVPYAWLHGKAPRLLALTRSNFVSPISGRVPSHSLGSNKLDAALCLISASLIVIGGPLLHLAMLLLGLSMLASLAFPIVAPIVALTANASATDATPEPPDLAYLLSATYAICALMLLPLGYLVHRGPSFSREVAMKHALYTEVNRFEAQTLLTPQLVSILGRRCDEAIMSALGARAPLSPLLTSPEASSWSFGFGKGHTAAARQAAADERADAAGALRFDETCSMCLERICTGSRHFMDWAYVAGGTVPHLPLEVRQVIWAACADSAGGRSDAVRTLACGHKFHQSCFSSWEAGRVDRSVHSLLSSVESPRGYLGGTSHAYDFLCHVCYRKSCFNPRCRDKCPNCCACGFMDDESGERRFYGNFESNVSSRGRG